ncbi:hypothetical protein [Ochrobactrum sp. 3-3]|uniref:hypothetical protein n=1 Tax=Ochrobactrum sp. 3-3 TaxID=1830124 RepID=UPI002570228A|nr:hypothetical protein [Ochrobactrum sp. 3-3]
MAKRGTSVSDFAVAPRRSKAPDNRPAEPAAAPAETSAEASAERPAEISTTPKAEEGGAPEKLIAATEAERRERATTRALEQENSRNRIRDLKRARERESKHFVNVPLDYDTKKRLERAAHENDLKMTVIMKAAIDQYLKDNGY